MRKFTSLLLLGFALGSFAQTPGGVSGSELWFKTAPLNSDLQEVITVGRISLGIPYG